MQQPLVVRELLVGIGRPRGVNDRHQIVGAEMLLDELLRRHLHARARPNSVCRSSTTIT